MHVAYLRQKVFFSDGAGHPRKTISLWWPGQALLLVSHFGIYCIECKIVTPTCGFLLFILFLKYTSLPLFFLIIYLFIFGCVGSSFLCEGFL